MLDQLVKWNFFVSVFAVILSGILVLTRGAWFFPAELDLYGPLRNNLVFVLVILALLEALCCCTRYARGGHREALGMGGFVLFTALGFRFHGLLHDLPVAPWLSLYLAYAGLSHLVYGLYKVRIQRGGMGKSGGRPKP